MIFNAQLPTRHPKSEGITLLELLVVITLIAILSVLVYPSFGNALSSFRLKGEGRQLVAACRYAKWEAVAKRRPFQLVVNSEKGQVQVADVAGQVLKAMDLPSGIRISQSQRNTANGVSDTDGFYFYPNGTAESGVIVLRDDGGRSVKIVIDLLTGDAKIESL